MQAETKQLKLRAAASNNPRALSGVDGRSAPARRFRDLLNDIAGDIGGFDRLSVGQRAKVRQVAAMMLRSEQMQAAIVRGEIINDDEFLRLSSETRRLLSALATNNLKTDLFLSMGHGE